MRGPTDALRSLKRYVAEVLGDAWEVRDATEEGVFRRPLAMVWATGAATITGPAHTTELAQPFTVALYPQPGATGTASLAVALEAEEQLLHGLRDGVGYGAPFRVPLMDYRDPAEAVLLDTLGAPTLRLREVRPRVGSTMSVTVATSGTAGLNELRLLDAGRLVRSFSYAAGAVDDLASTINAATGLNIVATDLGAGDPALVVEQAFVASAPVPPTRAASRSDGGYLRVQGLDIGHEVDQQEPLLVTVTANLRLTWLRGREVGDDLVVGAVRRSGTVG